MLCRQPSHAVGRSRCSRASGGTRRARSRVEQQSFFSQNGKAQHCWPAEDPEGEATIPHLAAQPWYCRSLRERCQSTFQVKRGTVVPLEDARVETCGSKSTACAELARLSGRAKDFRTARGACLPFGNMHAAIRVRIHTLRCTADSYLFIKHGIRRHIMWGRKSAHERRSQMPTGPDLCRKARGRKNSRACFWSSNRQSCTAGRSTQPVEKCRSSCCPVPQLRPCANKPVRSPSRLLQDPMTAAYPLCHRINLQVDVRL